nr:PREDICTED: interferon alpha/beta receptor 2-like [Lepisosteus oculatus]
MAHLLIISSLLLQSVVGLCSLPAPVNVTIDSLNLEHILKWDPGPGTPTEAQYRAEYFHFIKNTWSPVRTCLRVTSPRQCDLTEEFKVISSFYVGQVQAFTELEISNWSVSNVFHPSSDTVLGPPELAVSGCGNCLRLQISPPKGKRMHRFLEFHHRFKYICEVLRLRDGSKFTVQVVASDKDIIIEYLEPGTEYCITAKMQTVFTRHSQTSQPCCAFTSPEPVNTVPVTLGLMSLAILLTALVCGSFFCHGLSSSLKKRLPWVLASMSSSTATPHCVAAEAYSMADVVQDNMKDSFSSKSLDPKEEEETVREENEGYGYLVGEANTSTLTTFP